MIQKLRSLLKLIVGPLASRSSRYTNRLSFANVVKENVFATDLDAFIQNREIRKEFYGPTLPAASWVQVQRLYLPSFVVEIELTAEYPK